MQTTKDESRWNVKVATWRKSPLGDLGAKSLAAVVTSTFEKLKKMNTKTLLRVDPPVGGRNDYR